MEGEEGRFDAAVVEGVLEWERWDRWLLQRIHRALRSGGTLRVTVPALDSAATAIDLPFLSYASRQVLRRAVPGWSHLELPGPARRRYRVEQLARKLESAGFTDIAVASAQRIGRSTLLARKAPSLPGVGGAPWPDAGAHLHGQAAEEALSVAAGETWLARFPEYRQRKVRALEPRGFAAARILVLSPHPDDELIGCGGTLRRLRAAGAGITILEATDGSRLESLRDLPAARRRTARLDEAARVARELDAVLVAWGEGDTKLAASAWNCARLAALLDELRPTHVFTPFLADRHADHRALSAILAGALARSPVAPEVLQYEVWGAVPANLYCDVTSEAQALERLLWLYERAMRVDNFVRFCARRNLARALRLMGRAGYAEAFLATRGDEFQRLAGAQCVRIET